MIPKSNVELFLENIAEGFKREPGELMITLGLIILFVILPSLFFMLRRMFQQAEKVRKAKRLFTEMLSRYPLTPREKTLLKLMASRCRKEKSRLPELLADAHFFNKYARVLSSRGTATYTEMALLQQHLNLRYRTLPVDLHSTAEFLPGMPMRLTFQNEGRSHVQLLGVENSGLVVPAKHRPGKAEPVCIEFARHAGYYCINTRIKEVRMHELLLEHSEDIHREQKRHYYRTRLKLGIAVKFPESDNLYPASLIDLSGGGAKFHMEDPPLRLQQELELIFNPGNRGAIQVPGRIVRIVSPQGNYSLSFSIQREGERDRIIRFMQKNEKNRKHAVSTG